ncbi:hypothetical protein [Paraburkholderia sp. BL21I4N1]|uniref:hypothetical protein n=1 Tax=Paraburkholderia sp. BL21I4N1 TaxID=1938801 RepID=UPI000CFB5B00|nr:hypothetical protein [Paraburkholderia sp. BL21I4N1]
MARKSCVAGGKGATEDNSQKSELEPMSIFLSNQVVPFCLRDARLDESLVHEIIDDIPEADFEALQGLLCDILKGESVAGKVSVRDPATRAAAPLHSIIYNGGRAGNAGVAVVSFSFSNAAEQSLFAIFGLIAATASGQLSFSNASDAYTVFRGLWSSLSALRSPQDDDAIAIIRSLGVLKTKGNKQSTNLQIEAETGLPSQAVANALQSLEQRRVILCTSWGGQSNHYAHPANLWEIKL